MRLLALLGIVVIVSACASEPVSEQVVESAEPAVSSAGSDPLTGTWTGDWGPTPDHRNTVALELTWDGSTLSGTVNPGPEAIALSAGSFDAAQNIVTIEAEAQNFRGETVHYSIEGQIDGDTMTGSWNHDDQAGDFSIRKD